MISDLMFYAKPPEVTLEQENIAAILQSVVESFQAEAERQAIRLDLTLPSEEIRLQVDRRMLVEAVSALIRNAIEAIGCQGTLVVSLGHDSGHCQIHVADSGPGISAKARQHAFDPYFSGREAGRGLGLGLCRAFRIVQLHQGEISLAGGPAGCVATIRLPDLTR